MSWHIDFKVLLTSCFRYNSEEKSTKFPISKMKLIRTNTTSLYKFYNEIYRRLGENGRYLKIFFSIYLEMFTHSFQSFTKCSSYLIS